MTKTENIRPYRGSDHLWSLAETSAGKVAIWPLRVGEVYFDAAKANHLPANLPEGLRGSTVLTIGAMRFRASGNAKCDGSGNWHVSREYVSLSQYPSGRALTDRQTDRACTLLESMVTDWATTHAAELVEADDIDRNNSARKLEEDIDKYECALEILRAELAACESGSLPFTQYPELPTKR
jgi:hypothetical protein